MTQTTVPSVDCVKYSAIAARAVGAPDSVATEAAKVCSEWRELGIPRAAVAAAAVVALFAPPHLHKAKNLAKAAAGALIPYTNFSDEKYLKSTILFLIKKIRAGGPKKSVLEYVDDICSKLSCSDAALTRAKEIASSSAVAGGKIPAGIAAAAVYLAHMELGQRLPAKDVAAAAAVSEVTVRTRAKEIMRALGRGL